MLDKAKLGTRYTCFKCGCKFYDLNRPVPTCPDCSADQREAPARDIRALLNNKGGSVRRYTDDEDEADVAEPSDDDEDTGLITDLDDDDDEDVEMDEDDEMLEGEAGGDEDE